MQDKYVCDIGDYGKYGLLRHLMRETSHIRLGVVWYLAPFESGGDGGHTGYLSKPAEFRFCDPELFDQLKCICASESRSVRTIRERAVLGENAAFFEPMVCPSGDPRKGAHACNERRTHRRKWMSRALAEMKDSDLIFLDPDNGMGGKSFSLHLVTGHKHADWEEARQFASGGRKTLVIYHHAGHQASVEDQAQTLVARYQAIVPEAKYVEPLILRRGSVRIFLVAAGVGREAEVAAALESFKQRWVPLMEKKGR